MPWKKLAYYDEVAVLTDAAPATVGTAVATGTGTTAARADHVHALGAGVVDNATIALASGVLGVKGYGIGAAQIATGAVGAAAIGSNAVGAEEIDETATNIAFANLILTPATSCASTAEGAIFYDSDDDHFYGYVV